MQVPIIESGPSRRRSLPITCNPILDTQHVLPIPGTKLRERVIFSLPGQDGDDKKAVVAIEKVTHLEWAAELPRLQV